jgi:transcriptional regulator with XRE-family HTH domain
MAVTLGKKLRDLRREKGLTQQELAEKAGVDDTYISKIENDRLPYSPSAETIRLIAKILDADALELLAMGERTPKELLGFSDTHHAYEFLRMVAHHDMKQSDWQALKNLLEQRVQRRTNSGGKSRK